MNDDRNPMRGGRTNDAHSDRSGRPYRRDGVCWTATAAGHGGTVMASTLQIVLTIHTIFAALWTGGTLFVAGAVLPAARRDLLGETALALIARRFTYLTVASVVLLLFTGGHLAGTLYTVETLQSTGRGHLVLTMVGLWLVLPLLLYGGFRQLTGLPEGRTPATAATTARPWFLGASVVSIALLIVAGLL